MKCGVWLVMLALAVTITPAYAAGKHVRELPQHTIMGQGGDEGAHLPAVDEVRGDIAALGSLTQRLRATQDQAERRDLVQQYQLAMSQAMTRLRGQHGALARGAAGPVTAPATALMELRHRMADQIDPLQQMLEEMMALQFALLGL